MENVNGKCCGPCEVTHGGAAFQLIRFLPIWCTCYPLPKGRFSFRLVSCLYVAPWQNVKQTAEGVVPSTFPGCYIAVCLQTLWELSQTFFKVKSQPHSSAFEIKCLWKIQYGQKRVRESRQRPEAVNISLFLLTIKITFFFSTTRPIIHYLIYLYSRYLNNRTHFLLYWFEICLLFLFY